MTERGEYTAGHFSGSPVTYKTVEKKKLYVVEHRIISAIIGTRGIPSQTTIEYKTITKNFLDEAAAKTYYDKVKEAYNLVAPVGLEITLSTKDIEG